MVFKVGDRVIVKALYESGSGNPRHPCKGVILPPHECKMTLRETKYYVRFVTFNYGNLISRTLHLIDKSNIEIDESLIDSSVRDVVEHNITLFHESVESYDINRALNKLSRIVKFGNEYINVKEPWKQENPDTTLNSLYYLLNEVTDCYKSVLPNDYERIKEALNSKKKTILFEKLTYDTKINN